MPDDWMSRNTVDDVSQAINTQVIQTTLEKSNTDLSPQALQSFLTQAPIPRFYCNGFSAGLAIANTVDGVITYSATAGIYHDPYAMLIVSSGIAIVPVDGYYHFNFDLNAAGGSANYSYARIIDNTGGTIGQTLLFHNVAAAVSDLHIDAIKPMRAGEWAMVKISNQSGATLTPNTGHFTGVWIAPYNNYQGGQN